MIKILKIIGWLFVLAFFISVIAHSHTQNSTTGSNTLIQGNMESTTTENYSAATAVDNSSSTSTVSKVQSSPPSAHSPGLTSGIDTCSMSTSGSLQTFGFGVSGGRVAVEEGCEMRKNAKLLSDLGMKIAAISLLCSHSPELFHAMFMAESYCPINVNGKSLIGSAALAIYTKYPKTRGDYEIWLKQQEILQEYKDNQIQYSTGR